MQSRRASGSIGERPSFRNVLPWRAHERVVLYNDSTRRIRRPPFAPHFKGVAQYDSICGCLEVKDSAKRKSHLTRRRVRPKGTTVGCKYWPVLLEMTVLHDPPSSLPYKQRPIYLLMRRVWSRTDTTRVNIQNTSTVATCTSTSI